MVPKLRHSYTGCLNTPRLVADDTQKTVWKWEQQEPFGAGACNPDPDGDNVQFEFNLRFPGQYFDKETNAHYNYFRDYDPAIGRYVQSDPIGLRGGLNTFAYSYGHPTRYSDRFGLNPAAAARGGYAIGQVIYAGLNYAFVATTGLTVGIQLYEWINPEPYSTIVEARGKSDPVRGQKPFNPGRDCDGKCNACPPPIYWDAEGNEHGSTSGSHWHGLVWNQDPRTCMCYPNRLSGPDRDNLK